MTAKTIAERQRAFKASKTAAGLTEVRGIFAPADWHAEIRVAAARVLKRKPKVEEGVPKGLRAFK